MGSNPPNLVIEEKMKGEWYEIIELVSWKFFPSKTHVSGIFRDYEFQNNIFPENGAENSLLIKDLEEKEEQEIRWKNSITLQQMKEIDWEEEVDAPKYLLDENPEDVKDELIEMFKEHYKFYLIEKDGERTEVRTRYLLNRMTEDQIDAMVDNQNFDKELMRKLSGVELSAEEIQRLMKLNYLELENNGTIEAEIKTRADFRPPTWNLLIKIMENIKGFRKEGNYLEEDVRLFAYYT